MMRSVRSWRAVLLPLALATGRLSRGCANEASAVCRERSSQLLSRTRLGLRSRMNRFDGATIVFGKVRDPRPRCVWLKDARLGSETGASEKSRREPDA